jgi:hypothetical protein
MGRVLPKEAQDLLDSFESMRTAVGELRAEVQTGLPNVPAEELRVRGEVLDALGIHLEVAFAAAHVAADLWKRSAIEAPALLAAVKEPSRVVFEALGLLWDADVASSR